MLKLMVMTTVHGKQKVHGKNDAWAIDFSLVKCEIETSGLTLEHILL